MGRTFEHEGNEMKKVLLASTALAMTAGVAAAEVTLSGYAEIGIKQAPVADATTGAVSDEILFHHDLDVKFTLSGTTDNGLTFGGTIDLDEVSGGISSEAGPHSVFISGDFGTVTMGDTDGAFDWAMSEIGWGTSIADDHTAHGGWNGNSGLDGGLDGQVARYEYSFGDFAFAVSAEIGDRTTDADGIYGIGAKYSGDLGGVDLGIGVGYQDGDYTTPSVATTGGSASISGEADIYGISIAADFDGGFGTRLNFSSLDGSTTGGTGFDWNHYGIGVTYGVDNIRVEANYGEFDGSVDGAGDFSADGFGFAFNYDLGGGAVFMAGYGSGTGFAFDGVSLDSTDTWSIGFGLNF